MKKYNIGIIGRGFVGKAVAFGFSHATGYNSNLFIYDKDKSKSQNSLDELVSKSDVVFISVPTPSNLDGSMNSEILDDCLNDISTSVDKNNSDQAIYLIRSTVVPGTSRKFQKKYKNLKIVFNPEFLTERSANFDFISQTRIILGGTDKKAIKTVKELYQHRFGESLSVLETDYESAELIKYLCNNFFAVKVSFLNEMKIVSDKIGADWNDVIEGFIRDGRVGNSHTNVPGPDGKFGFGGSCFPKDIQAMINFSEQLNINLNVLRGAWKTNLEVRPEKDWEELKGRAIIDD